MKALSARGSVVALLVATALVWPTRDAEGAVVPSGFSDRVVLSGLNQPSAVAFASDGRVFVAEKPGIVKVFDSLSDPTATVFADLRTQVYNFIDRGLLGLALHPQFPVRPYVYVLYTYDAPPGGTAPTWNDTCPNPPGATTNGCVAQARLSRLTADGDQMTGAEQPLVTGWCQQFPSHSIGTLTFGPDGYLYAGAGDAASYHYADYGQTKNPCGDPPLPAGTSLTPPSAEGGALRAQSARRPANQPKVLNGAIVRVDPDTGVGAPGNPFASSPDQNARRIIAYGLRNPYRFTTRPGTEQLWIGEVGWNVYDEINRIADVNDSVAENFGWPCYEGPARQPSYDSINLSRCESLYATAGGHTPPVYNYRHDAKVVSTDACDPGSTAVSGLAFEDNSNYPATYDNALFFADAVRGCIWAMRRGSNGSPDPAQIVPFVSGAGTPVQLVIGPGGDLFYLDMVGGALHRVSYNGSNHPPTAVVTADPTAGGPPLTVTFDGTASSDLDSGDALTYTWDLDGDGQFDDATGATASHTYTSNGTISARLRVSDPAGAFDIQAVTITVGPPNQAPVPVIDSPTSALRWKVGETISFSGHATDAEDGALAADRLSWSLVLNHCPSNCHAHPMQDFVAVAGGTFPAPDHEYPSHLSVVLTATDSVGRRTSTTLPLEPATVDLTFASSPSGLRIGAGSEEITTPVSRRVIVGTSFGVSAPFGQTANGVGYAFDSWSDGGAATHNLVAPTTPTIYTATYREVVPGCPATPSYFHRVPSPPGPPAATPLAHGRVAFATQGADGQYYLATNDLRTAPPGVGPLQCSGGSNTQSPAVGAGSGFIALFARSSDNGLWQRTLTASSAGTWSRLPSGATTHRPAVVVTPDNAVHLVVRGTNGAVFHATRRGTTWSAWENLGGTIVGPPAVARGPSGGIAVVGRGTDNGLFVRMGDTGLWTPWTRVGTGKTLSEPALASGFAAGRLDLFVAGTTGGLFQSTFSGGRWGAWSNRDATVPATAHMATAAQPGLVIVYVESGGSLTYRQYLGGVGWVAGSVAHTCATCFPASRSPGIF